MFDCNNGLKALHREGHCQQVRAPDHRMQLSVQGIWNMMQGACLHMLCISAGCADTGWAPHILWWRDSNSRVSHEYRHSGHRLLRLCMTVKNGQNSGICSTVEDGE